MKMNNKRTVLTSFFWKFIERGSAQLFSLIVQIVLARILDPDNFGTLAVLLVFVNISNVLIQKGFATSLVQRKDIDDIDINTVMTVSEGIAALIYIVLWFAAPYIESFYGTEQLGLYLRVIAISLFFGAFYSIENSLLVRTMRFKQMFIASFISTVIAGITGIALAYLGRGCWALIVQNVLQQLLLSAISYPYCKWKVKLQYSKKSFKNLFGFGSNVLLSELLYTGVENLRTLIIGAEYSSADLAYYDRGQTYPSVAMRSIYDSLGSVMLPVFSKSQDEKDELKDEVVKSLGYSVFLVAPCFIGFALVSGPFTSIFLTDKWLPAVPFMRIFCIYQLGILPYCILRNALYGIGKSRDSLVLEILKAGLTLLAIFVGMLFNTLMIAICSTLAIWITTFMYWLHVKKLTNFQSLPVLKDFILVILYCFLMALAIFIVNRFLSSKVLQFVIDVLVGLVTYIVAAYATRNRYLKTTLSMVKKMIRK